MHKVKIEKEKAMFDIKNLPKNKTMYISYKL